MGFPKERLAPSSGPAPVFDGCVPDKDVLTRSLACPTLL